MPTGVRGCFLTVTWSGFFPSRRADRTRRPGLNVETVCNLIECAFVSRNVAHFEALYAAAERSPALRSRYAVWFDGARLDSPEAAQARERQEQLRALENDRPPRSRPTRPAKSRAARGSRSRPLAGVVAANLLFDADAGKPGFRERARLFRHRHAGMGRRRRVASAPDRRLRRTILGRSRNQHRCLAGP